MREGKLRQPRLTQSKIIRELKKERKKKRKKKRRRRKEEEDEWTGGNIEIRTRDIFLAAGEAGVAILQSHLLQTLKGEHLSAPGSQHEGP